MEQVPSTYRSRSTSGGAIPPHKITLHEFEEEFNHHHQHFLRNLSTKYDALSPQELCICSMIFSRIASREICRLLNISIVTVENHRYHIRRKLGLQRKENLYKSLLKSENES